MKEDKYLPYGVLFLRLTLAFTLLAFVADKLGLFGEPGTPTITWGDMDNFSVFLQTMLPFMPENTTQKLAVFFTVMEVILALMLLFGLKVRWAALGTGIYSLVLSMLMLVFVSLKAPFNYSLVLMCGAAFLLACCPIYKFTLNGVKKRSTYHPY